MFTLSNMMFVYAKLNGILFIWINSKTGISEPNMNKLFFLAVSFELLK
jgi:hypothetical protein